MADYTPTSHTGDGATTTFAVNFSYIDQAYVYVDVDGVDTSFSWVTAGSIEISPAPTSGAAIVIYRNTPHDPIVTFSAGATRSEDLNTAIQQARHIAEEADYSTATGGDALTAKIAAEAAQALAEAAQAAAEAAQAAAELAETGAAASETAAGLSETAAAASETAAGLSETAAAASAVAAQAAQTAAEAAQTAAEGAQTAAESAETGALAAQTAAEAARDNTLAAYDNFDDRYLGAKASAPTVDNDGNPLIAGALYFDTTSDTMFVYTGSAWTAAYVSGGSYLPLTGGTMTGNIQLDGTTQLTFGTTPNVGLVKFSAGVISVTNGYGTNNGELYAGGGLYVGDPTGASMAGMYLNIGNLDLAVGNQGKMRFTTTNNIRMRSDSHLGWASGAITVASDTGLIRDSAGVLKVTDGSTGDGKIKASTLITGYSAPVSPVNGEIWTTNIGLYYRVNGFDYAVSYVGHTHTFAEITSKPTTLSGYGITDAYTQAQVQSYVEGEVHKALTWPGDVNYTLTLADKGRTVMLSGLTVDRTITVPTNASVAFPVGTRINVGNWSSTYNVTIAGDTGVTIYSKDSKVTLSGAYAGATLEKVTSDGWWLVGDLA